MQVRLGTADQNPELQPREIQDYAGRQGWQIVETYPDTISVAKASRPGLNRLMADAMSRKFDCLLISKLDRFGCSLVAFTIATCVSARVASLTRCVPLRPRKHVKPALTRPRNPQTPPRPPRGTGEVGPATPLSQKVVPIGPGAPEGRRAGVLHGEGH